MSKSEQLFKKQSIQNVEVLQNQTEQTYVSDLTQFEEYGNELYSSKRTFFKDSSEMTNIKSTLGALSQVYNLAVNPEAGMFTAQRREIAEMYERLIDHCNVYVETRRKARTSSGKERLSMVRKLLGQAIRERDYLKSPYSVRLWEQSAGKTMYWRDFLFDSRTAKLDLDSSSENITEVGNGSSEVIKISMGNQNVYFKPMEYIPQVLEDNFDTAMLAVDKYLKNRNDDYYKEVYDFVNINIGWMIGFIPALRAYESSIRKRVKDFSQADIDGMYNSPITANYVEILSKRLPGQDESAPPAMRNKELLNKIYQLSLVGFKVDGMIEVAEQAKLETGDMVSQRNVATSRLAKVLGIDDIIAESRMATVTWDGKRKQTGIIMKEAHGTEMKKIYGEADTEDAAQHKDSEYTADAVRQLAIMSVFDTLCGQVDRNLTNILLRTETVNGRRIITGATGIDNDGSFGNATFEDMKRGRKAAKPIVDQNGDFIMPCIDKEFYENLSVLSEEHVRYLFADILKDENITAFVDRLENLKALLASTVEKQGPGFLIGKDDWGRAFTRFEAMGQNLEHTTYLHKRMFRSQHSAANGGE